MRRRGGGLKTRPAQINTAWPKGPSSGVCNVAELGAAGRAVASSPSSAEGRPDASDAPGARRTKIDSNLGGVEWAALWPVTYSSLRCTRRSIERRIENLGRPCLCGGAAGLSEVELMGHQAIDEIRSTPEGAVARRGALFRGQAGWMVATLAIGVVENEIWPVSPPGSLSVGSTDRSERSQRQPCLSVLFTRGLAWPQPIAPLGPVSCRRCRTRASATPPAAPRSVLL